jgi:uncharacterized protein (DUF1501 family)
LTLPSRFTVGRVAAQSEPQVLLVIFQRGAVDGLNMVVPYGETAYYERRPTIAIPPPGDPSGAVDLDGFFGLHPALAPLQPLYASGELAVVHACGSPVATRSHFDAQDFMETAVPGDKSVTDGWLNRYLHVADPRSSSVFRGAAITHSTPRALAGPAEALAIGDLGKLALGRGRRGVVTRAVLEDMYAGRDDLPGVLTQEALRAVELADQLDPDRYQPANGAEYPGSHLGTQLRQIAQAIRSDVGLEVAFAETEGWDTHAVQGGSSGALANLLHDLAAGLTALRTDLGDRFAKVCVLTMSEFGRTLGENGSAGTDHGYGTAMLVLGGAVRGGSVYGDWPGLAEDALFDGRDLAVTTDFRTLCAEIVVHHLGYPNVADVLPGFIYDDRERLGVIA